MEAVMHILEVIGMAIVLLALCALLLNARQLLEICVDLLEAAWCKLCRWWKRMTGKR